MLETEMAQTKIVGVNAYAIARELVLESLAVEEPCEIRWNDLSRWFGHVFTRIDYKKMCKTGQNL